MLSTAMYRVSKGDLLCLLALAAAALLALQGGLFTGGVPLGGTGPDHAGQILALRAWTFNQWNQGHLPLWNPHLAGGLPTMAIPAIAPLYPPNWLYRVLPLIVAARVDVWLNTALIGLWMFLWARQRGVQPVPALVAGVLAQLGGAAAAMRSAGAIASLAALAWTPLIFLSLDGIVAAPSRPALRRYAWAGAAAVALLLLAGDASAALAVLLMAAVYFLLCLRGGDTRSWAIAGALAMLLAGALISAIQWLSFPSALVGPTWITVSFNGGTQTYPAIAAAVRTTLSALVDLNEFDSPPAAASGLFVGLVALSLAIYGATRADALYRKFAGPMAGIALLLAIVTAPSAAALRDFSMLPGMYRSYALVAELFIALLASVGLNRLLRTRAPGRQPAWILATTGLLLLLAGAWLFRSSQSASVSSLEQWARDLFNLREVSATAPDLLPVPSGPSPAALVRHAAIAIALGGVGALLAAACWSLVRQWRFMAYGIAAVAIAQLGAFAGRHSPATDLAAAEKQARSLRQTLSDAPDGRVTGRPSAALLLAGANLVNPGNFPALWPYAQLIALADDYTPPPPPAPQTRPAAAGDATTAPATQPLTPGPFTTGPATAPAPQASLFHTATPTAQAAPSAPALPPTTPPTAQVAPPAPSMPPATPPTAQAEPPAPSMPPATSPTAQSAPPAPALPPTTPLTAQVAPPAPALPPATPSTSPPVAQSAPPAAQSARPAAQSAPPPATATQPATAGSGTAPSTLPSPPDSAPAASPDDDDDGRQPDLAHWPLWPLLRVQWQYDGLNAVPSLRKLHAPALRRARLIPRCVVLPDPHDALDLMRRSDWFNPRQIAIVPSHDQNLPPEIENTVATYPIIPASLVGSATVSDISPDELDVDATAQMPAVLLITDACAAGWHVRSRDADPPQQYDIAPADLALRGIALGVGTHHLRLYYSPWRWVAGKWISSLSLLVFAVWGVRCLWPDGSGEKVVE